MGAFRDFKNSIRDTDKNIQLQYEQANNAIQQQQFDVAKILLEQIKQQHAKDPRWMHGLGNLYHYTGENTLAYHYYMQAAQLKFAPSFDHLGQIEVKRHNYLLAEHYFISAIQFGYQASLVSLGKILFNQYRITAAIDCFEEATQAKYTEALIPLAQCYIIEKQYPTAQKILSQALDSDIVHASYYIGEMYQQQRLFTEAKNWYIHAFQIDRSIRALEKLGQIFCAEGKIIDGEKMIKIAQKLEDEQTLDQQDNTLIQAILGNNPYFQII